MRQKVLLITLTPCYPLYHGGALAQYYFLDGLKNETEFVLCTQINSVNEKNALSLLQTKLPALKIYYLDQSFAGINKPSFLKAVKLKIKKIIYSKKKAISSIQSDDFKDSYFQHIDNAYDPQFIELINTVIEKEQIKQIQFDFYNTIDLCFALPENIRKIFVNHEVRFKRLSLAAEKSQMPLSYINYLIKKTRFFEQNCIKMMDEVVVFNDDDAALLRSEAKKITVSPFGIPDELIFDLPVSKEYNKLLFIGGEAHTPNLLGLSWFLDTIFLPNIEKIRFPLHIIGDWSDLFKQRYAMYDNIFFCGVVDSVMDYFNSTIFVNPILTGAGLRTKVIHAFSNKVPVLSTRFGAEGCFTSESISHLGLFDTAEEFISRLQNIDFANIALRGYDYYNNNFSKEQLLRKRLSIYN